MIQIRPARHDDVPGLLTELGYPDNQAGYVREWLMTWESEPNGYILVAETDKPVGLVTVMAIPFMDKPGGWARVTLPGRAATCPLCHRLPEPGVGFARRGRPVGTGS